MDASGTLRSSGVNNITGGTPPVDPILYIRGIASPADVNYFSEAPTRSSFWILSSSMPIDDDIKALVHQHKDKSLSALNLYSTYIPGLLSNVNGDTCVPKQIALYNSIGKCLLLSYNIHEFENTLHDNGIISSNGLYIISLLYSNGERKHTLLLHDSTK